MSERKVILYISMSLDGYVSTSNDDISFLNSVHEEGEDFGYADFTKEVDTYIVGRKTHSIVKDLLDGEFPQALLYDCYVITRQSDLPKEKGVEFYTGDLSNLITSLKEKKGKNIYCDGGPQIVKLLLAQGLIDELIISIIPVLLGDGKRLFIGGLPTQYLKHKTSKAYKSGLVQVHYTK